MSNVVALSRAGNRVASEVDLEVVDIQRPFLLAQWDRVVLALLVDQAVSEAVSVVGLKADVAEAALGEAFKTAEVMVVEGEVLATKEAEASRTGAATEEIVS